MIDFHALLAALHLLGSSWQPWAVVIPGILIGLLVHAVPGLTTSMALAICLPLIPYMDFLQALIFMTAMYAGAVFGVAVPAILLNVPGSAAAVGTTFDGFPMARAGKHNEALGLALAASCFGQAVVYSLLLILAGPIGALALKLGPPEMLVLSLWGVTLDRNSQRPQPLARSVGGCIRPASGHGRVKCARRTARHIWLRSAARWNSSCSGDCRSVCRSGTLQSGRARLYRR